MQFVGGQKTLDEAEPAVADLVEAGIGDPHRPRILGPDPPWRRPVVTGPGGPKTTYAGPVRAVQFDMADPAFPGVTGRPSRARAARTGVGPGGGDHRRHLRERPPPVRPQHRTVTHLDVDGLVPLRARPRDRRPGHRGGTGWPVPGGDPGGRRPVHPLPGPGHRPRPAPTVHGDGHRHASSSTAGSSAADARSASPPTSAAGGRSRCWPTCRCSTRFPRRCPTTWPACTSRSRSPATACCAPRPPTVTRCWWSERGIIGLATVAALKGLYPRCPVTVLARHAHQAEAAVTVRCRPRGEDRADDNGHCEALADLVGARVIGGKAHRHADGWLPLRGGGGRVAAVGHRGAAGRGPPGHRAPARRGRHQRSRPDARSGTRKRRWSARSTTPWTPAPLRGWPAGPTGTPSTGPSTCWPPASSPAAVVTHRVPARGVPRRGRDGHRPRECHTPSRSSSDRRAAGRQHGHDRSCRLRPGERRFHARSRGKVHHRHRGGVGHRLGVRHPAYRRRGTGSGVGHRRARRGATGVVGRRPGSSDQPMSPTRTRWSTSWPPPSASGAGSTGW